MSTVDTSERNDERREAPLGVVLVIAVLALVIGVFAGWSLFGPGDTTDGDDAGVLSGEHVSLDRAQRGRPDDTPANPRSFGISGDVDDIYPTYAGTLRVIFTNPHRFEIVVTELDARLDTGACGVAVPADVFSLDDSLPGTGVTVPRRVGNTMGTSFIDIALAVTNGLPDECQNTSFPITYSGTAIRANQQ